MSGTMLQKAVGQLDAALALLEVAARRKLETERGRGNLETELTLMQDDRARLAVELDGTLARLNRVEGTAGEVGRRLDAAMGSLRAVISRAEAG